MGVLPPRRHRHAAQDWARPSARHLIQETVPQNQAAPVEPAANVAAAVEYEDQAATLGGRDPRADGRAARRPVGAVLTLTVDGDPIGSDDCRNGECEPTVSRLPLAPRTVHDRRRTSASTLIENSTTLDRPTAGSRPAGRGFEPHGAHHLGRRPPARPAGRLLHGRRDAGTSAVGAPTPKTSVPPTGGASGGTVHQERLRSPDQVGIGARTSRRLVSGNQPNEVTLAPERTDVEGRQGPPAHTGQRVTGSVSPDGTCRTAPSEPTR